MNNFELQRSERELAKGPNWGEITYKNLELRKNEKVGVTSQAPPRKLVRDALESHATVKGPLDATDVLFTLGEENLLDFFSRYTKLQVLYMRDWATVSHNVLRTISVTFGELLVEMDLSNAMVDVSSLKILFVRASNLSTLKINNCAALDTPCTRVIVQLLHCSLTTLYVNSCPNLRTEPLLWIGGTVGLNSASLRKLKTLDLGECPLTDKGLLAVAEGCKRLTFLNLQNCTELTDISVVAVVTQNSKLRLLNLSGCSKITSKSVAAAGRSCPELTSINLSRCCQVSDKGIKCLALGCRNLQAVNVAGLLKMSEDSMFALATKCRGLLSLNLTGCERITINGLNAMVEGLDYVEKGVSFMGFKPIDAHVERKLLGHLAMVQEAAGKLRREQMRIQQQIEMEAEEVRVKTLNGAVMLITAYMGRYKKRMHFFGLWRLRVSTSAAITIQRVFRGTLGRERATVLHTMRQKFRASAPYALIMQRYVRAHLSRNRSAYISKAIREMYAYRRKEAHNAVAVRLQAQARRYLATDYVQSWRELCARKDLNQKHAVVMMQQLARRFVSVQRLVRRRMMRDNLITARRNAGAKISLFLVEGMKRYKSKLSGDELKVFFKEKWTAATAIQCHYRGFKGREDVRHAKIEIATSNFAAREVQRMYRGTRVLHWRDMRLNVIAAFVLDRHYVERRAAIASTRMRYKQYVEENQRDSASEPDDDEDDAEQWFKQFDADRQMYYWQNLATSEISYDIPLDALAHEKNLVGHRVKVFWVVQSVWYEGNITQYHKRKRRHRVEYDDGDHEWVNLQQECDRVQVMLEEEGLWTMYAMYQSEAMVGEQRKREERRNKQNFQQIAFRDANQWRSFVDDKTHVVMFLSTINGEIRTGVLDSLNWVVQDDGIGFPCFYNVETAEVAYEDPRFVYEVSDDLAGQRRFVMQELRIAVYFCKDLWEKYVQADAVQDNRQTHAAMVAVRNSPKPIHLNAFLIRARALYRPTSVVDKPMEQGALEELAYAAWLAERLAEVCSGAERTLVERRDNKRGLIEKMTEQAGARLACSHCHRETKRHLDFCATCGKPQVTFEIFVA
ncbi:hypothetical protein B484DRAFT_401290 [Ochromonadaceae sp. CCMP2298]|nr:hypothetical protein B484DRAFT_401290 [Ochromonadaceae sp. CCMP2298]|mmetsp:Transcript_10896/g.24148  ORF Transcript_10896/g.24148 Transcript_10896/m.24148 type:complete len:1075 (-) Transcript_10896:106-3330(-)